MEIDLQKLNVCQLLSLYAGILEELRSRNITRSSNAPLGDYTEYLFCKAFDWCQEGNSKAGYDAACPDGIRYQIKGRRPTRENPSRQLSFIRRLPDKQFHYLAAILFHEDYSINKAAIIPHEVVESRARYSEHANGWLFHLEDDVWNVPGVRDVTDEIEEAISKIEI